MASNSWRTSRRPYLGQNIGYFSFTTGVAEHFSMGIVTGYANLINNELPDPHQQGPIDVAITSTYMFYDYKSRPGVDFAMGYLTNLTFPTGTQSGFAGLGSRAEYFSFLNGISVTKDFGDFFTSNYFAGFNWYFGPNARGTSGVAVVETGFGYLIKPWFQPEVEFVYQREFLAGNDAERASVVGGFVISGQTTRVLIGVEQSVAARNTELFTIISASVALTF